MLTTAKKVGFSSYLTTHLASSGSGLYEVNDSDLKYVYKSKV